MLIVFFPIYIGCIKKVYVVFNLRAGVLYQIKTRGAAERIISDKARIASILNGSKNDPFYTHLVSLFAKEFSIKMLYTPRKSKQKFCDNPLVFYQI